MWLHRNLSLTPLRMGYCFLLIHVIQDISQRMFTGPIIIYCIVISAPPRFRETPLNKTVQIGQSALLRCSAASSKTTITWSKDDAVLGGRNLAYSTVGLLVVNANRGDMGWYVCTATNRGGSKVVRVYLRVLRAREAGKA